MSLPKVILKQDEKSWSMTVIPCSDDKKDQDAAWRVLSQISLAHQDEMAIYQELKEYEEKRKTHLHKKKNKEFENLVESIKEHERTVEQYKKDIQEQQERSKNINWLKRNQRK